MNKYSVAYGTTFYTMKSTAWIFYFSMHKQGIVANDGPDFIAKSIESAKRNKMLSTPCVLSDYVRSKIRLESEVQAIRYSR